jgi:hypothetical protein
MVEQSITPAEDHAPQLPDLGLFDLWNRRGCECRRRFLCFHLNYAWWLAGVVGGLVGSAWNFAMSSVFTWGRR